MKKLTTKQTLTAICCSVLTCAITLPILSHATSAYSGYEQREIKALSVKDQQLLKEGAGMGYALAAELNQYPGPKHVLELKHELKLSSQQIKSSQTLFNLMKEQAQQLGQQLINAEQKLDALFKQGEATEQKIQNRVSLISNIEAKLRTLHLSTHIQQRDILTSEQQKTYQHLRGYTTSEQHTQHKHLH